MQELMEKSMYIPTLWQKEKCQNLVIIPQGLTEEAKSTIVPGWLSKPRQEQAQLQRHLSEAASLVLPTLDTWFLTEINMLISPRGSF